MASTDRRPEGKKTTPWSTDGTLHQWRCNDCGSYVAQAGALSPEMQALLDENHEGHDAEALLPTVLQGAKPKRRRTK